MIGWLACGVGKLISSSSSVSGGGGRGGAVSRGRGGRGGTLSVNNQIRNSKTILQPLCT